MTTSERRNLRNGLLFALPYVIGVIAFEVYPIVMSLYYGFCQYNIISKPVWVGLQNYAELFFADQLFLKSVYNTLYYTAFAVPSGLALSVGLAVLLNTRAPGVTVFRTVFFLPSIVPMVASAMLWLWVLNPESGLLNGTLRLVFGVEGPGWMADEHWSKPSLVVMSFWGLGAAVVIFLAGLSETPQALYEVARIDGAGAWKTFRHVTLPMLTPTILFNLVMGLIGSFQYFTQVYVMTAGRGGPVDSTMFYALYLYRNSFSYLRMGYACAMAWMLFLLIFACTIAVFASSRRWVYYHGE